MVFFDRTLSSLPISKVKIDDYLKSFFLVEQMIRRGKEELFTWQDPTIFKTPKKGNVDIGMPWKNFIFLIVQSMSLMLESISLEVSRQWNNY